MKNTRKKVLLSSVAMLLVALVALGSATYAWFTINKEVEANTIKVQASVASGLVINNTQTANWTRTVSYANAYKELNPVSFDITKTDGTADMPTTGYYFRDVKADGPLTGSGTTASATSVATTALPSGNKASQDYLYNDNTYVAAYTMQVANSGSTALSGSVSAAITATGTSGKDGTVFAKAALVKGGKVIGFYTDEQYYPITSTGEAKATKVAADASTSIPAIASSVPSKDGTPETFTLYVWYEGNDDDCTNTQQGYQTDFKVTFTLA